MQISGFLPIIDTKCKTLVLGSIPSVLSLDKFEYYGNPRNQFWHIITDSFNDSYIDNYEVRIKFLLEKGIGLWDVISTCYRQGSLDSKIKQATVNDFRELFCNYRNINKILFNGKKAYSLFVKKIESNLYNNKKLIVLPSSSPANTMTYALKLLEWKEALIK